MKKDFLPPLIAHRGAPTLAPENTLASLQAAKQFGAHFIEFDVMLTKDNVAVIMHDKTLNRTTNGKGKLSRTLFADLRQLDAGSWFSPEFKQEKVPTLVEYLIAAAENNLGINIELKAQTGTERKTAEIVQNALLAHWPKKHPTPLLSSFSVEQIKVLHQMQCPYPLGLNLDKWNKKYITLAKAFNCYSVHVNQKAVTPERIERHRDNHLKTLAYTVNDKQRAEKLLNLGVTAIFSDIPNLLETTA